VTCDSQTASEWVESQYSLSSHAAMWQTAGTRAATNQSPKVRKRKQFFFVLGLFVCLFVLEGEGINQNLWVFHEKWSSCAAYNSMDRESV